MIIKRILMKITSRERPEQLLETVRQYIVNATNLDYMLWLFSFDANDKSYNNDNFISQIGSLMFAASNAKFKIVFKSSTDKIDAINRDINEYEEPWDILLNISDDQRPIVKGYDQIIRDHMPDHFDKSLWFFDGHQNRINTMEIQGRAYYDRFKYVYNRNFKSFFCDNLSTDMAIHLKKMIKSNMCIIKHFHPQWDKNGPLKVDALYKRNDKYWKHDESMYHKLKLQLTSLCQTTN